jgi:predicted glycosyl hydrolase (DUF1957 family)
MQPGKKFKNGLTIFINHGMNINRAGLTYEESMEKVVTNAQREVFLCIDEYWKHNYFAPTLREIAKMRGKSGLGNTKVIVDRLVELGVLKRLKGKARSVRPCYINFKEVQ